MFLCASRQEARYVFESNDRNIEAVAETDKARSLVRSIDVEHTGQVSRLVGYDTYRTSAQASKSYHDVLGKVRHHFKEVVVVDYRFNDVLDVVRHVRVIRNDCHQ